MIANGLYPYNADNASSQYRPLITPSYFDENGTLPLTASGTPKRTPIGFGTTWPVGLSPAAMFDLGTNVKCMYYNVKVAFRIESDFNFGVGSTSYSTSENFTASGLIKRFFVTSGSMFRNKFASVNKGGIQKDLTERIGIELVKSFYDLREGVGTPKNYWWWPRIYFQIQGSRGAITNGHDISSPMLFEKFPVIIPSIPIMGVSLANGLEIETIVYDSRITLTERYDTISFSPKSGPVGTQVTITCPAWASEMDSPAQRDGFEDVIELRFGDSQPVTTFTKTKNANDVYDTITVTVPNDATTGPIKFKAVMNPAKAATTTDYYTTCEEFKLA